MLILTTSDGFVVEAGPEHLKGHRINNGDMVQLAQGQWIKGIGDNEFNRALSKREDK